MNKITFKKGAKATGLARVGNPYPSTDIRLNGADVGTISPPNNTSAALVPENQWTIRLQKPEGAGWKWITLKKKFDSEPEAREFITRNADKIIALGLYSIKN